MFAVFLDTCTLFGSGLSTLFLNLAERGTYRPLWSRGVLEELERTLMSQARLTSGQARRRIDAMVDCFIDAEVRGYEDLVEVMRCDPEDRHVLAAAVRGDAALIVTFNLRHFPEEALAGYDLVARHPDDFLLDQLDLHPGETIAACSEQLEAYEHPPLTRSELVALYRRAGAPRFADRVARIWGVG